MVSCLIIPIVFFLGVLLEYHKLRIFHLGLFLCVNLCYPFPLFIFLFFTLDMLPFLLICLTFLIKKSFPPFCIYFMQKGRKLRVTTLIYIILTDHISTSTLVSHLYSGTVTCAHVLTSSFHSASQLRDHLQLAILCALSPNGTLCKSIPMLTLLFNVFINLL